MVQVCNLDPTYREVFNFLKLVHQMVYELYGLSEEEIRIVEESIK